MILNPSLQAEPSWFGESMILIEIPRTSIATSLMIRFPMSIHFGQIRLNSEQAL